MEQIKNISLSDKDINYILDLLDDELYDSQEWGIIEFNKEEPQSSKMGYLDTDDTIYIKNLIKSIQNQI